MLSDMQGLHGLGSLLQPRRGQDCRGITESVEIDLWKPHVGRKEVDLAVDEPQPQGSCSYITILKNVSCFFRGCCNQCQL